jgi:hypothetical protein
VKNVKKYFLQNVGKALAAQRVLRRQIIFGSSL